MATTSTAEEYINDIIKAQTNSAKQQLKSAYDANVKTLDKTAAEIPKTYRKARGDVAVQSEIDKRNFNEYAAGAGLNSGAGSQAELARIANKQANLTALNEEEASAISDINLQKSMLETAYQNDVAAAINSGDLTKAQYLYEDYINNMNALNTKAQTLAAYGDFSGYKALGYTDDQIANMKSYWNRVNSSSGGGGSGTYKGNDKGTPTDDSSDDPNDSSSANISEVLSDQSKLPSNLKSNAAKSFYYSTVYATKADPDARKATLQNHLNAGRITQSEYDYLVSLVDGLFVY